MADGAYERRGPREAELARLKRILAEAAEKRQAEAQAKPAGGSVATSQLTLA